MTIAEFIYTVLLRPRPLRRAANATLRALLPERVRIADAIVCINPDDPVVSGALTLRVFERGEIAFFRSRFQADMTLVDVGANVGLYTALALSTRGFRGKVLAVEPHAESRRYLNRTVEANATAARPGAALICGLAASDRPGTLTLYQNSENKGDNRIYPDPLLDAQETVAVDRLDNICREHGIRSAQFIKMDVQGAEARVIRGAGELLANSPDCILLTEFWPYGLSQDGQDALAYLESLSAHGFILHELAGGRGALVAVDNPRALIERTRGRRYANLVGLKGKFAVKGV